MSTDAPPPAPPSAPKPDYKSSLNLPKTDFPMKADLVKNEPARLAKWQASNLYERVQAAHADDPRFLLHDGPPFANGDIHIGHVINKTLKDVVLRYKTMTGHRTPYVPGWDCHGLPIEHKIQENLGPKWREMPQLDIRRLCFDYAQGYVEKQSEQFQRVGILGDWAHPYRTMAPAYEARVLEVFARIVERGLVYQQLKPVNWSIENGTALAEADLEYKDVTDTSVFVEFPAANPGELKGKLGLRANARVNFLIWTTTPWTLPANLAIAAGPEVEYALVQFSRDGESFVNVVAVDLVEKVFARLDLPTPHSTLTTVRGRDLEGIEYQHPFAGRGGKIVLADYVTTTDGTGLVHTAPGHGDEDYQTGRAYGLDVYCPVLGNGRYDSTVPGWLTGLSVWQANPIIIEKLKELGVLFAAEAYPHSYPHDARSKKPTIYRATEQWFVSVDKRFRDVKDPELLPPLTVRQRALCSCLNGYPVEGSRHFDAGLQSLGLRIRERQRSDPLFADAFRVKRGPLWGKDLEAWAYLYGFELTASEKAFSDYVESVTTRFLPEWGNARLLGMLDTRPDWVLSRQRAWGLPMPIFTSPEGKVLLDPTVIRAIAKRFADHGSNAWFEMSPAQLLEGTALPAGFDAATLRKGSDTFDVWFESGNSWFAVVEGRADELGHAPVDLYLEGSDQHRGWFQLSMLSSIAVTGTPPFKAVLTHGFAVKPDGTKVSKSDKEYVKAVDEINRHGADVLRLWVCSMDYQGDLPISPKALADFGDKYRKLRNTIRYLLSNIDDFDPWQHSVPVTEASLDRWMLNELGNLTTAVREAYDAYKFHLAFRLLHDFCAVQISSVYGNAMKDRLYCERPDSPIRRRAQLVMYECAVALIQLLAPMCVFTADEAWEFLRAKPQELDNVHLSTLPKPHATTLTQPPIFTRLMKLRDDALLQLDGLKKSAGLNKASEAEAIYTVKDEAMRAELAAFGVDLEDLAGCGFHSIAIDPAANETSVQIVDRRNDYAACARSWKRRPDVGRDSEYPELSRRDADAVRAANAV